MGSHPLNLAIRFLLEVTGLAALAWMGWHFGKGMFQYLLAIGFPLIAATLWGVFAVPGDPSRSSDAVVAIPGTLRLILELAFFAMATWSFFAIGAAMTGRIYAAAVVIHYLVSIDRVVWLAKQ